MTRYGPEKFKGRKTLPIKQLIALGKFLCDKIQEIGTLPADVDYYFKDVIKERAYLSQHFRVHRDRCEKDITDTINHEHFTERSVCHSIRVASHALTYRQSQADSSNLVDSWQAIFEDDHRAY